MPTAGEYHTPPMSGKTALAKLFTESAELNTARLAVAEARQPLIAGHKNYGLFTKKPVTIEAIHYTDFDSLSLIGAWLVSHGTTGAYQEDHTSNERYLIIKTLEGNMRVNPGDWVIRGIKGEFYPCKPDIFEATYGPVTAPNRVPTEKELEEIKANKTLRKALDEQLQALRALTASRERAHSITKLQEAIMWLGMDLKRLSDEKPYPNSYDPKSPKIDPVADGLKL